MRCLNCGYDLRGLPKNRCPECGRAFDPSDRSTFIALLPDGRRPLAYAGVSVAAWIISAAVVLIISGSPAAVSEWSNTPFIPAIAGMLIGVHAWASARDVLRLPSEAAQHRGSAYAALIIGGILGPLTLSLALIAAVYGVLRDIWA